MWADQLGTPRQITDPASNAVVWRWDSEAFGNTQANQDPGNTGNQFVYNLRFPGQYYDAESGRHYNYFRDYDPQTGRYVQSDPIGLAGGSFSTYAYVNGNPIGINDPLGLMGAGGQRPWTSTATPKKIYARKLTECEIDVLQDYFPDFDLHQIYLHNPPGSILPFPGSDGTTFGNDVYVNASDYNGTNLETKVLLGHEATHSRQASQVGGTAPFVAIYLLHGLYNKYRNIPEEVEAYKMGDRIRKDLKGNNSDGVVDCSCRK
ncbi:putative deoxyribonuclease RhsC [Andreprevotia sp. IGB-42]|uniref:RHS repeat-associated core domain-containing protein n=1 Tax=Andreprevotia sp. IGB-42 TaxID=2497473 RepID=UPI00157F71BD|nr:RHS repeat-associated core domain-containing protein [Andreprevotia sp. IGB-42]KAF0813413.1 putative deoxyribonuclease RhsC [Andreprevotia sp. IGB-42]